MKTLRLIITSCILLSLAIYPDSEVKAERAGTYRYVVPGDSLTSTTCTRDNPCELSYAVYMANPGDTIIVHSGTYYSTLPTIALIAINKDLTLLGSCYFDASTAFQCLPDEHSSILDAQNTKHVIRVEGTLVEEVYIEGFTISHGSSSGMLPCIGGGVSECGAGIHAFNLEKLTLKNNILMGNVAGYTSGIGGGLFAEAINFLQVENNTFSNNQATKNGLGAGGAAFVINSGGPHAVIFENNLIFANEVSSENNTANAGGGILVTASNNVQIRNNKFEYQNTVQQNTDLRGSSLYLFEISGFSIEGNSFIGNYGNSATYISFNSSDGQISQNKWWNNQVISNLELVGNIQADIYNNFLGKEVLSSMSRGGGTTNIYIHSDGISGSNDISILFNTIAAASAGINVGDFSDVQIANNIFTGLIDSIYFSGANITSDIQNNLFFNNLFNTHVGTNPVLADPKLVDIANGEFHLLLGSGAINMTICGDFDEDIDGDFRPAGSGSTPCDIGADEYYYSIWMPLILQ